MIVLLHSTAMLVDIIMIHQCHSMQWWKCIDEVVEVFTQEIDLKLV
jgi:hypothetical protein